MKKILAMMLTAAMMLSMGTAAMAEEKAYEDEKTVTITKVYKETNENTTSPAETFKFTVAEGWGETFVTDSTVANTADAVKASYVEGTKIEIGDVAYAAGAATVAGAKDTVTITLPEYTVVGVYYYTIKETPATTAGVTYYAKDIMLKVTVIEQDGKVRVAAVHTEDGYNGTVEDGTKKDEFENIYSAGSLEVTKVVKGNLGDKEKEFDVTVTFESDKTVGADIHYGTDTDGNGILDESEILGKVETSEWVEGKATADIKVKDGTTILFTNIPYDVTYTVDENDYSSEEYKTAYKVNGVAAESTDKVTDKKDAAKETVEITNTKDTSVDTGISVDSIPYIAMLGVVAVGGAGFMVSKKRRSED